MKASIFFSFAACLRLDEAADSYNDHQHAARNNHEHGRLGDRELEKERSCGFVDESTPEERAAIDATVASHMATLRPLSKTDEITINVYWHVITTKDGNGDISDTAIEKSILVLNEAFGGVESSYSECSGSGFKYKDFPSTPFKFVLKGTNRVSNKNAHNLDSSASEKYRKKNRVGSCADLNIFSGETIYLGFAFFPANCPLGGDYQNPSKSDAVVVNYGSVPEGSILNYNQGDTLTHEVGHWLGLYHTFEGSCSGGDSVSDTPAEAEPAFGCPIGKNTCPGSGIDPIHNFMDYTHDCCMYSFTDKQINRMVSQVRTYRGLEPGSNDGTSDDVGFNDDDDDDDDDYEYGSNGNSNTGAFFGILFQLIRQIVVWWASSKIF